MRFKALLVSTLILAAHAQSAPTVDDAKRAIEKRLQKIWQGIGTKGTRTVLFQDVRAGRSTPGSYAFQATLLVHDEETGYPPNHYYGRTCVGKLTEQIYMLSLDPMGNWDAQGVMTAGMNDTTCKNNPSAGVSSIPLSSLQGTKAAAGGSAPQRPPANAPAAIAGQGLAQGNYECWGNGQARSLLNFTMLANNQYRDSEGHVGAMRLDGNGRVTFQGGNLDGFMPAGFYAMYHAPGGRPTLSFRNSGGSEVQFCEHR